MEFSLDLFGSPLLEELLAGSKGAELIHGDVRRREGEAVEGLGFEPVKERLRRKSNRHVGIKLLPARLRHKVLDIVDECLADDRTSGVVTKAAAVPPVAVYGASASITR